MKPVALLVNPPAPRPAMRDYYCSSTSKAGYLDGDYDVRLLDAPAATGFAQRDEANLFDELDALHGQGVRYLFVKDFTFNAARDRATMILERWTRNPYRFRWVGYFRADRVDAGLAELLRRTGCRMAQLGIETMSREMLARVRPGYDPDRMREGIAHLRRAGVPYGAHFVLGLPGDAAAYAMRRAYRRFYLRPGYLGTLIRSARHSRILASLFVMGVEWWRSRKEAA